MMLDNLEPRSQGYLTTDSPAPLERGRSRLQDDVAYLLKEWGIFVQGQEKIKGVMESRLCKISLRCLHSNKARK